VVGLQHSYRRQGHRTVAPKRDRWRMVAAWVSGRTIGCGQDFTRRYLLLRVYWSSLWSDLRGSLCWGTL
jgi:hypothetical protein